MVCAHIANIQRQIRITSQNTKTTLEIWQRSTIEPKAQTHQSITFTHVFFAPPLRTGFFYPSFTFLPERVIPFLVEVDSLF